MSINRNVFHTFLTQFPTMIFGIFSGIFITRLLGPEGKGVYAVFQADIHLFTLFLGLGLSSGIIYFVSNKKFRIEKLLGISVFILFLGTALVALTLFLLKSSGFAHYIIPNDYNLIFYFVYILISFVLIFINGILSSVLKGKTYFKSVNNVSIINGIVNALIFGVLYFYFRNNPDLVTIKGIFLTTLIILLLNTVFWLVLYIKHINVLPEINMRIFRGMKPFFTFVFIGYIADGIHFFNYRLDIWIIDYYRGVEQVGFYALAVNIAQMFWIISIPIATVLFPYLSNKDGKEHHKNFAMLSRINITLVVVLAGIAILTADLIIPLVYGKEFANSVLPFKILTIGIVVFSFTRLFSTYLSARNKIKYNLYAALIGLFFTIVSCLLLIPDYGIEGASISTSVSYISISLFVMYAFFFKLKAPVMNYLIVTQGDIKILLQKIGNGRNN